MNLPILSNWDNDSLPQAWSGAYNDIWGYVDGSGKEYAILGTIVGTYFINITDPANPQVVSFFKGKDTIGVNRDFKTYSHYAYGVCDQGNSSLQIFDLQNLPNSVTKIYDSDSLSVRCHTLFIEHDRIYMCSNTTKQGYHSMDVLSLADPENPTYLSTLSHPQFFTVHAAYVRKDTAFLSCGNEGMFVYNYADVNNPVLMQTFTSYPEQGYNHSSWTSDDGKTLIFADERHGRGIKVYDISNLDNPVLKSIFRSNLLNSSDSLGDTGSIPHNPYMIGNKAIISYYHDGVQVFDLSDTRHPVRNGYFDTDPLNTNYSGYGGAWGVYPFLPSHHIIASDLQNGLFVLDGNNQFILGEKALAKENSFEHSLYPNPAKDEFYFSVNIRKEGPVNCKVYDISGESVLTFTEFLPTGVSDLHIDCTKLSSGAYFINSYSDTFNFTIKFILVK